MSSAPNRRVAVRLAIVCVVGLAACGSPSGDSVSPPSATAAPSATVIASPSGASSLPAPVGDAVEDRADAILENIEGEPDWPLEGFGSLWLMAPDSDEPSLLRVDPATNEVIAAIGLPGPTRLCQGFTVTDDAVWACTPDGALRIDPATNSVAGEVTFEAAPVAGRLAFGSGSVWAIGSDGIRPNVLVRIDPTAMTATAIPLGHGGANLAYGFDAVWITAPQDGLILRVDPASEEVTEHATGLARPQVIVVGPDSLWVTLFGSEEPASDETTVVRIDPTDGSAVTEIATGAASENLGGLWATEDAVWVRAPSTFLTRIDPATNEVVETVSGPAGAGDVTVAFGSLWATAGNALTVYRLAP